MPGWTRLKSTMTSARSAGAMQQLLLSWTGSGRYPPSLPIWVKRHAVAHAEDEEARLGPVEQTQTVPPLLDVQVRPRLAVHDQGVAEELGVPLRRDVAHLAAERHVRGEREPQLGSSGELLRLPGHVELLEVGPVVGVEQRPVGIEGPVLDRDRDLVVLRARLVAALRRRARQLGGHTIGLVTDARRTRPGPRTRSGASCRGCGRDTTGSWGAGRWDTGTRTCPAPTSGPSDPRTPA